MFAFPSTLSENPAENRSGRVVSRSPHGLGAADADVGYGSTIVDVASEA
jgi:hypothetical protein